MDSRSSASFPLPPSSILIDLYPLIGRFSCKPSPGAFPFVPQMHFYAREIGCQLEEHLSYGSISAWWWSFKNPRLCHMLLDGVDCPQVYRLCVLFSACP